MDLSLSQVKGDKADSEISEVVVPQEGGPSPFHGHVWDSSVPEARRVRACGIAPAPRVGGQVVSLQFSRRHGGGQRLSLEGRQEAEDRAGLSGFSGDRVLM